MYLCTVIYEIFFIFFIFLIYIIIMKFFTFFFWLYCIPFFAIAQNCACQKADFQSSYDSASVIFVGKVTEFTTNWMSGGMKATFAASKKWKDVGENLMVVNTPFPQNCGYTFEVGKEYLVYAKKNRVTYKTSTCYRTVPIENAEEDLAKLGKSGTIGTGKAKYFVIGMSLWVVGSSLFILFVILRKRKKKGNV